MKGGLNSLLFVLLISVSLTAYGGSSTVCALGLDGPMDTVDMDMGTDGGAMAPCPVCIASGPVSEDPASCPAAGCVLFSACPHEIRYGTSPPVLQPEHMTGLFVSRSSGIEPPPPRAHLSH